MKPTHSSLRNPFDLLNLPPTSLIEVTEFIAHAEIALNIEYPIAGEFSLPRELARAVPAIDVVLREIRPHRIEDTEILRLRWEAM